MIYKYILVNQKFSQTLRTFQIYKLNILLDLWRQSDQRVSRFVNVIFENYFGNLIKILTFVKTFVLWVSVTISQLNNRFSLFGRLRIRGSIVNCKWFRASISQAVNFHESRQSFVRMFGNDFKINSLFLAMITKSAGSTENSFVLIFYYKIIASKNALHVSSFHQTAILMNSVTNILPAEFLQVGSR